MFLNEFDNTLLKTKTNSRILSSRFKLTTRKVKLRGCYGEGIPFPTLYGDGTCAQAIYLCSYEKALALMPHPKIKPVRMPGKRAVLAISCYEYKMYWASRPTTRIVFTIAV